MGYKALICAAGYGTGFYPYGKVVNKGMLPLWDRPVIHHLVTEIISAGITDIGIVIRPDECQLPEYFREQPRLRDLFYRRGWEEKYHAVEQFESELGCVSLNWIVQRDTEGYGSALPLLAAEQWLGDSDWVCMSVDDVILGTPSDDLKCLINLHMRVDVDTAIQVAVVPATRIRRCGIVSTRLSGGIEILTSIVEKPRLAEAPSDLAYISRLVADKGFFRALHGATPNARTNEFVLSDCIAAHGREHRTLVHRVRGAHFHLGSPLELVEAMNYLAEVERQESKRGT
jgi:UTP--glucose-1-phosphate uridylyltransferase